MRKKNKPFYQLEYLRKRFEITQKEMAALLGIKQCTYSNKVNRGAPFTLDEAIIIQRIFNKKAEKLKEEPLKLDQIFLP